MLLTEINASLKAIESRLKSIESELCRQGSRPAVVCIPQYPPATTPWQGPPPQYPSQPDWNRITCETADDFSAKACDWTADDFNAQSKAGSFLSAEADEVAADDFNAQSNAPGTRATPFSSQHYSP